MHSVGGIARCFSSTSYRSLNEKESSLISTLRGASALSVLVGHAYQTLIAHWYLAPFPYFGLLAQFAVMVFFVLSGFLIGKSITRATARRAFSLRDYGMNRAVRIMPPLVFALLLTAGLACAAPYCFPSGTHAFLPPHTHAARAAFAIEPKEMIAALLMVNGFAGPTPAADASLWSLPIEVWLYAIAGLAMFAHRPAARVLLVLAMAAALTERSWTFTPYALVWGAGFCICLFHNHGFEFRRCRTLRLAAMLLVIAAADMAAGYVFHCEHDGARAPASFHFVVAYSVLAGLAFAAVFAQVLGRSIHGGTFLRGSARYSYTLYVINFPLLLFTFGALQPWVEQSPAMALLIALAASAATVGIASLSARFVENTRAWRAFAARAARWPA